MSERWWRWLRENGWPVLSALVAGGAISGPISLYTSHHTREDSRQIIENRRDLDLVDRFAAIHFASNNSYRLSVYIVRLMKADQLKRELRHFIFWDIMERNFARSDPTRIFNPDDHDWHLLGDAMLDMKRDLQRSCWEDRDWFRWWTRSDPQPTCAKW